MGLSRVTYSALLLALLATSFVHAADHVMFLNCSRVAYCSRLRTYQPTNTELFAADLYDIEDVDGTLNVPLSNKNGTKLNLKITAVPNNVYRIVIEEPDSHRYKLEHVLAEEPETEKLKLHKRGDTFAHYVRTTAANDDENYVQISQTASGSFQLEFYTNDQLLSVIDGSRLVMENTAESQAFTFAIQFSNSSFMMGLSEHAQAIPLLHTADQSIDPYRLRNLDNWAYEINSTMGMYGSIPVLYSHGDVSSGLFVHNAAQEWIDIDNTNSLAYFMIEGGTLDLFVLMGPTIESTVKQYISLTGTATFMPLWTFGYHQSRWGYYSQEDVKNVTDNFESHDIQLDVIWLDYNWTNAGRYFEWNPDNYSDPIGMLNYLDEHGRKMVVINDPHTKVDMTYPFYAGAIERELFVNVSGGKTSYIGSCWPGNSSWVDYLNPEAREYWASYFSYDKFNATPTLAGFWNDMNEASIFDETIEKTLTNDMVQYRNTLHRDVHNIYGHTQIMGTYSGLLARDKGRLRPFILTRSHFAGSQRYAGMWTGDNTSEWPYIWASWTMCATLNLLGMPFCGADIGGFEGSPSDPMLIRWYQAGAWLPFMRGHSNIDSARREPYLKNNVTQGHLRTAIQFRYKHVPVWYTLFYKQHVTGDPVIRPLFYNYPRDKNTFGVSEQLIVGTDIMARVVYDENATSVNVYFPGESDYWFQVNNETGNVYQGGQSADIPIDISFIPVFYRAGSIIPRKEIVRSSTKFMKDDPYVLHCMLNKEGKAHGELFIDDYTSFDYRDAKKFNYVSIDYDDNSGSLSIRELDPTQDAEDFALKISGIMIHAINGTSSTVRMIDFTSENVPLEAVNFKSQPVVLLV